MDKNRELNADYMPGEGRGYGARKLKEEKRKRPDEEKDDGQEAAGQEREKGAGGQVIDVDFEKGKERENEPEKAAVPEQEQPASFFEDRPDEAEERLAERKREKELKDELKAALKKLHRAVDTRRSRNKKLEGEPLARAQRKLAEELMAKGEVKDTLTNWFQKNLGNEPKNIIFELIKDSWDNEEEMTGYYVRIGQEKNMWLKRRLEEMMEVESREMAA